MAVNVSHDHKHKGQDNYEQHQADFVEETNQTDSNDTGVCDRELPRLVALMEACQSARSLDMAKAEDLAGSGGRRGGIEPAEDLLGLHERRESEKFSLAGDGLGLGLFGKADGLIVLSGQPIV